MSFLLLVIAFVIQRRLDLPFSRKLDKRLAQLIVLDPHAPNSDSNAVPVFIVALLVISVVCYFALESIREDFYGIAYFFIQFLLLVFLIGDAGFKSQIERFIDAYNRGDSDAAHHILSACYPREAVYQVNSRQGVMVQGCAWLIDESFRRYFLMIFWFFLFGGVGAFFVRVIDLASCRVPQGSGRKIYQTIYEIVAFIPARLIALCFLVAGNTASGLSKVMGGVFQSGNAAIEYLLRSAGAVLSVENLVGDGLVNSGDSNRYKQTDAIQQRDVFAEIRALLSRSLSVCFLILAIISLI